LGFRFLHEDLQKVNQLYVEVEYHVNEAKAINMIEIHVNLL